MQKKKKKIMRWAPPSSHVCDFLNFFMLSTVGSRWKYPAAAVSFCQLAVCFDCMSLGKLICVHSCN